MILGIDFSVIAQIAWHRMASPGYEARSDIEIDEFQRNLASMVYALHERFKPEQMDFLMDGPKYWRKAIYPKYYAEHGKIWEEIIYLAPVETIEDGRKVKYNPTEKVYYIMHDHKYYSLKYYKEFEKYNPTKMDKAAKANFHLCLETEDLITPLDFDKAPKGVTDLFPTYKGNRDSMPWKYDTPKSEFKTLMNSIAKSLAKTFCARVVMSEEAEADDLAYVYHADNSASDMIFVTTDSDWTQLLRHGMFLQFFNPAKNEFVECSQEKASLDLAIKIMCGDSSDNIPAISLKGQLATLPAPSKKAKKPNKTQILAAEHGKDIYKFLGENAEPHALKRNYQLIFLGNCPKVVQADIRHQFTRPNANLSKALGIEQYGLTDEDCLEIRTTAKDLRDLDMVAGTYAT